MNDGLRQLHDVDLNAGVKADGACRRTTTQADDQCVARIRMQRHRQKADAMVHVRHRRSRARLVDAVDRQREFARRLVNNHRRTDAFLAPHDALPRISLSDELIERVR